MKLSDSIYLITLFILILWPNSSSFSFLDESWYILFYLVPSTFFSLLIMFLRLFPIFRWYLRNVWTLWIISFLYSSLVTFLQSNIWLIEISLLSVCTVTKSISCSIVISCWSESFPLLFNAFFFTSSYFLNLKF